MRRIATALLGVAVLLLTLSTAGPSLASTPPDTGPSADPYQPVVDADDLEALDRMRVEIQRSIAVGTEDEEQLAAWRYDWAYLNWRIGQLVRGTDKKRSKSLLKEAEEQLDLLIEAEPENAEAHALRGSAIGDRISGAFSGAMLGGRSSAAHELAREFAPDNPRVALLRGIGFYYTPKTFGGGREIAEEELRRALELFEQQPVDTPWPSWGHVDALAWLGIVVAEGGKPGEARRLYERALVLRPENRWVRHELLAGLEE